MFYSSLHLSSACAAAETPASSVRGAAAISRAATLPTTARYSERAQVPCDTATARWYICTTVHPQPTCLIVLEDLYQAAYLIPSLTETRVRGGTPTSVPSPVTSRILVHVPRSFPPCLLSGFSSCRAWVWPQSEAHPSHTNSLGLWGFFFPQERV